MLAEIFENPKPILATVSLLPLPGALGFTDVDTIIARAEQEATALASGGVHGLILENSFDRYVSPRLDPAAAVLMGLIARRIQALTHLPLGISVMPNDPETALAVAAMVKAAFIRLPVPLGVKITEQGLLESKLTMVLADLQRLKVQDQIGLVADLSSSITLPGVAVQSIGQTDPEHLLGLAHRLKEIPGISALLVSDRETDARAIQSLQTTVQLPVWVHHEQNINQALPLYQAASGLILDIGIRTKGPSLQASAPSDIPKVDMARVEEIVNRLLDVKSLQDLPPDFFVGKN